MKELQEKEFKKLITFLNAINCAYKIITDDGNTFWKGNVHPEPEKPKKPQRKKRNLSMPYGTIASHYKPFINVKANVGDVIEIPYANINPVSLRSAVCSYLVKQWGKGTYTTMLAKEGVQIMRTEILEQQ
jgi:hypothetical protein